MNTESCTEISRRLGIEKKVEALSQHSRIVNSGLLETINSFHSLCETLVAGELFDNEFSIAASKTGKNIRQTIAKLSETSDETVTAIANSNLSEIMQAYLNWWVSLDFPPASQILKLIATQIYLEAENFYAVTKEMAYKRVMVRVSRDFGIVPTQLPSKPISTFEIIGGFFQDLNAFNDFERSLKGAGTIPSDCPKKLIRSIFKNEGLERKLPWLATISDLKFLLKELISREVIVDPGQDIWSVTLDCFDVVDAKGKTPTELRRSLREAKLPSEKRQLILKKAVAHFGK